MSLRDRLLRPGTADVEKARGFGYGAAGVMSARFWPCLFPRRACPVVSV